MNKDLMKKPLIIGGMVTAVLVTFLAVIAFIDYQRPSTSIVHEKTVQHRPETASEDSLSASKSDNPSSNIMAYNRAVQTFRETALSEKHEADGKTYNASPESTYEREKTSGRDSERDEIAQDPVGIASTVPSPIGETNEGNPDNSVGKDTWEDNARRISSGTGSSKDDSAEDYSLPSERGDDENPLPDEDLPQDEDLPEETEPSDQSVVVSREFISVSIDEGVISVALFVLADGDITSSLTIREFIPRGWEVVDSFPEHNTFNNQTGEITWSFRGNNVMSRRITYTIQKNEYHNGRTSFTGYYRYNDINGNPVEMQVKGVNGV